MTGIDKLGTEARNPNTRELDGMSVSELLRSMNTEDRPELDAGPEVLTGSTRLKGGTAQKLVLNMLSTATMVRLGKVYGNLMVDLRPTNLQLVARARRILAEATGCDAVTAADHLERAGRRPRSRS